MQYSQEKKKFKFHWMVHGGKAWKHQTILYLQVATTTFCGDTFMCRIAS